jgi:hypothetical protein
LVTREHEAIVTIYKDDHIWVHKHAGIMGARYKSKLVKLRRQLVKPRLGSLA